MVERGAGVARAAVVNPPSPQASMTAKIATVGPHRRLGEARRLAHRWKGRVFFAFLDQGAYSLANFVLTILYASWLPLDTFGRYVVVWTASLFIETIQVALIVDSLPAIVSRHGRHNRRRLDTAAFWVVVGYSLATSVVLVAAALIISPWRPAYLWALLAVALANPFQRLYLLFRRLAYIHDRQRIAAAMAACYGVVSVVGAFILVRADSLSLASTISLWGIGALAGIVAAVALGVGRPRAMRSATIAWLAIEIWRTGRWLSGAAVANWISNWAIFPLIAVTTGAGAAGIIRALQNLLTPIVQFNAALHLAVLPRVADNLASDGDHYGLRFARRGTAIFTAIAASYCAVILAAAHLILPALYRKPEIAAAAYLLWPLALAIVLDAVRQASAISLLARRRTRIVFTARWIALAVFAGGALLLRALIGFVGILWATAAPSAAGAGIVLASALSDNRTETH
jgi:O-antigen/teichoic acid export membrane protein